MSHSGMVNVSTPFRVWTVLEGMIGAMTRIAALAVAALLVAAGPSLAPAGEREEANKKTVVEFYEKALNQKDFEAAAPHFGARYVQHNPNAPDGIEGFKGFLGFLREKFPSRAARSSACSRTATT